MVAIFLLQFLFQLTFLQSILIPPEHCATDLIIDLEECLKN